MTKIIDDKAFKAIKGRTIAKVVKYINSIEIYFTDNSFINIEISVNYYPCRCGPEDYCYCSPPESPISAYFNFIK